MNGILNSSSSKGYQKCTTLLPVSNNKEVIMFVLHKDLEDQKLCLFLSRFWWENDESKDEKG
jgi:hypothetical protein